jgi:hypothetical protein
MKRMIILTVAASFAFCGVAGAATKSKDEVLSGFTRTGQLESCLPLRDIDNSQILDDQTILFKTTGKQTYLNELPGPCPELKVQGTFSYKTPVNRLCNTDSITVVDTALHQQLSACLLGKFEKLTPKEKAAN